MKKSAAALAVALTGMGSGGCEEEAWVPAARCTPEGRQLEWHDEMQVGRQQHTATLMRGGTLAGCVVVVGGLDANREPVKEIEIFDPGIKRWATLDAAQNARVFHTATWVDVEPHGYLVVVGGYGIEHTPLDDVLVIGGDEPPVWKATAVLPRAEHSATVLEDGRVLVLGGGEAQGQILNTLQPATGPLNGPVLEGDASNPDGNIAGNLFGHAAVRLQDGRVLVAGGADVSYFSNTFNQNDRELHDAWTCDMEGCTPAPPLSIARGARAHTLAPRIEGDEPGTLLLGGRTELRDEVTGSWATFESGAPLSLPVRAAFDTSPEHVLVFGGLDPGEQLSTKRGEIVPLLDQARKEASMESARYFHSATLLSDEVRVLIAGGLNGQTSAAGPLSTWEIVSLDPSVDSSSSSSRAIPEPASPLSCAFQGLAVRKPCPLGAVAAPLILAALLARRSRRRRMAISERGFILFALACSTACGEDETQVGTPARAAASVLPLDASSLDDESPGSAAAGVDGTAVGATPGASSDGGTRGPELLVTWNELQLEGPRPSSRVLSTLVVDPQENQLMLFGGASLEGGLGDTWLLELEAPTQWSRHDGPSPPIRGYHAMAYSAEAQASILFGGLSDAPLGDTWSWDGSAWQQVAGAGGSAPTPRYGHALVYHDDQDNIVLFGGKADAPLGDTWTWTAGDGWRKACAPDDGCPSPPARYLHGLLFDARAHRVVLYGGRNEAGALNDTWHWDGQSWTEEVVTEDRRRGFSPHAAHSFGYAPDQDVWIVFGGVVTSTSAPTAVVWGYSDEDKTWVKEQPPAAPPLGRAFAPMAWDPVGQRFLIFGGGYSAQFRDLWSLSVEYHSPLRDCLPLDGACSGASGEQEDAADAGAATPSQ